MWTSLCTLMCVVYLKVLNVFLFLSECGILCEVGGCDIYFFICVFFVMCEISSVCAKLKSCKCWILLLSVQSVAICSVMFCIAYSFIMFIEDVVCHHMLESYIGLITALYIENNVSLCLPNLIKVLNVSMGIYVCMPWLPWCQCGCCEFRFEGEIHNFGWTWHNLHLKNMMSN